MGLLKSGTQCIIMKGSNFGRKITVQKIDDKFVYFKLDDKDRKLGLLQVFPIK